MMQKKAKEEESPFALIAQYQCTRVRALFRNYTRIFQITKSAVLTLDPTTFEVTNTMPYKSMSNIGPDEKVADQFVFKDEKSGDFVFKCAHRNQILCQLYEAITKDCAKFKTYGPYRAQRLRKNGLRTEAKMAITSFGIVEMNEHGKVLQEYRWVNITKIGFDEREYGMFFQYSDRIKIFYVSDLSQVMSGIGASLKQIGIDSIKMSKGQHVIDTIKARASCFSNTGSPVAVFSVNKQTLRSNRLMPRQMHITELFIVEKDASGFQFVSYQAVSSIYSVVRSWSNPRKFTIEYKDGSSRVYHTSVRDTILAALQDVCHAAGNIRVVVTGELSDSLRLIPRYADEEYKKKMLDSIFGPFSIEVWFLKMMSKAFLNKGSPLDYDKFVQTCREFNANVPFPGIATASDQSLVKTCTTAVLTCINHYIGPASHNRITINNPRGVGVMLQTLYRFLTSSHGYKCLVEIKEIDARHILIVLIKCDIDFVNYWAIQVLKLLCNCPLPTRNVQLEYVNKHTLLTDSLLRSLLDLMGVRAAQESLYEDDSEEEDDGDDSGFEDDSSDDDEAVEHRAKVTPLAKKEEEPTVPKAKTPWEKAVPTVDTPLPPPVLSVEEEKAQAEATSGSSRQVFFPNSLVIVASAELLESLICSKKDTTSPELQDIVLDLLEERYEILVHMLRSTSFLIMENAAILMHVLTKNRTEVEPLLIESVLSECLVLKHFYNGIFSPSAAQRFISRFLCATWMTGEKSDGKKLLRKLLPCGLVEYLKYDAISVEQRESLDIMEDEFYETYAGAISQKGGNGETQRPGGELQNRMRTRISKALQITSSSKTSRLAPLPSTSTVTVAEHHDDEEKKKVENYRIMFHVITQDHQLADLIWNEQTRLELRSALEGEINEFEKEQKMRGNAQPIAWNYQQFFVIYNSLKSYTKVGPIYIRHYLESGDAFIRTLINPSPEILFEKLMRRVLANVERSPPLATLCVRSLCRLYDVCHDLIGSFDDTMIIVKMLETVKDMELNHYILDLLIILTKNEENMEQLLDNDFITLILKYVSLSHLNPDQIGNALARATANTLMLEDASPHDDQDQYTPSMTVGGSTDMDLTEEERINKAKFLAWIPEDDMCPQVWYTAPRGPIPPPLLDQRGPFKVTTLLEMYKKNEIFADTLIAPATSDSDSDLEIIETEVDTGKWCCLKDQFQLNIQMLCPGKAIYSPAEVSNKAIQLLFNLASLHKSANQQGVSFYPTPISKRLMSGPEHLAVFGQMLLSNDRNVVSVAAKLMKSLVELNLHANSKLYVSGAFFFGCRYTGNDFLHIAELFEITHLKQSFHDGAASVARGMTVAQKSILGALLPSALVNVLHRHGAFTFSNVFTGSYDNPEIIWNPDLRRIIVDMVNQHLGDFPARLRQNTASMYDYIPIPKIKFPIDKELYCEEYYLRNLCDEVRFPEWPIRSPLDLLREVIQRWRDELSKGVQVKGEKEAKELFGLTGKYDHLALRKSYKSLARKYHPDRNPNGREMFEKIQMAYELLTSIEIKSNETNMNNVVIIMKTQNILYRRFPHILKDQKYPAYPLLIKVIDVPSDTSKRPEETDCGILMAAVELMFYTCAVSPLNAKEFVKQNTLPQLHDLIVYGLEIYSTTHSKDIAESILSFGMKTLSSIVQYDVGREAAFERCPLLAENMYTTLHLHKTLPIASENCIEAMARGAEFGPLQSALLHAGVVWRLIPMLLTFDVTLEEDLAMGDESQREIRSQHSCNVHGVLAAKALGRLGGYMFNELASPVNESMKTCMSKLLTYSLAKLLRNKRPRELLQSLNENVEKPTKIWNIGMRKELLDFVLKVDAEREEGSNELDLEPANSFIFSCLRDELCISGVYVRIFIKCGDVDDIDDPSIFGSDLVAYIWNTFIKDTTDFFIESNEKMYQCVESLRYLATDLDYIPHDLVKFEHGITVVFKLLNIDPTSKTFLSAAQIFEPLCLYGEVVNALVRQDPPCLWRLIRCLCVNGDAVDNGIKYLWKATEGIASIPDGLEGLMDSGCMLRLLGIIFSVPGYSSNFHNRTSAISLLSKFLWNPIKGTETSNFLRRFLPEPVVMLLKDKAGNSGNSSSLITILDKSCENPELIWTNEMHIELRNALIKLFKMTTKEEGSDPKGSKEQDFSQVIVFKPDFVVFYRQLQNEIFIGGVYIRLFLKQPTFRLSNPVLFLEKICSLWESSFEAQVPEMDAVVHKSSNGDSTALVLGKEDFLSICTSCIICIVKNEPSVFDHLISWGFTFKMFELLERAICTSKWGTPCTSIGRVLLELGNRVEIIDHLASAPCDVISLLTRALNESTGAAEVYIPKEASIFVEMLRKIFQCQGSEYLMEFVGMGMRAQLPSFLLDNIISSGAEEKLKDVRNASAMRVHAIDTLKAMSAVNGPDQPMLLAMLEAHSSWSEYRHQSHDLFITDAEKHDVFLIKDAETTESRFAALLLTDGSAGEGAGNMFASTGAVYTDKGHASRDIGPASSDIGQHNTNVSDIGSEKNPFGPSPSATVPSPTTPKPKAPVASSTPSPKTTTPLAGGPGAVSFISTTVHKGEHGIGLDLNKTANGRAQVKNFKSVPDNAAPNPAQRCQPAIHVLDVIVGVNGVPCGNFKETIGLIRGAGGAITLRLERKN